MSLSASVDASRSALCGETCCRNSSAADSARVSVSSSASGCMISAHAVLPASAAATTLSSTERDLTIISLASRTTSVGSRTFQRRRQPGTTTRGATGPIVATGSARPACTTRPVVLVGIVCAELYRRAMLYRSRGSARFLGSLPRRPLRRLTDPLRCLTLFAGYLQLRA